MIKDIKYTKHGLVIFALTVTLASCSHFQEGDIFEENASLRIEHFNDQLQSCLVAQSCDDKNGWLIQYFVDSNYEGFNLFGRFYDNGKVMLAGNHRFLRGGNANKYTESSSFYELLKEEGPVLTFNTWNDILTVFVDPVNPSQAPTTIVSDGEGMHGDQNLVFSKYENNNILFRGERHQAEVRFVPCDRSWEDYIKDTESFKKKITSSSLNNYYVTDGKDTMLFSGLNQGAFLYVDRLVDPKQSEVFACVFTPEGIHMRESGKLGEHNFQNFVMGSDGRSLVNEDATVKVVPAWDQYVVDCSSMWRIDPDHFTQEQTVLYQQMIAEIQKVNSKFELDSIAVGYVSEENEEKELIYFPGMILCIHGPKKMGRIPKYYPYINMGIYKPEYGVIKFEKLTNPHSSEHMQNFATTNLLSLCEQFAAALYGTYTMMPNDFFRPTRVSLTPVGAGTPTQLRLKDIVD